MRFSFYTENGTKTPLELIMLPAKKREEFIVNVGRIGRRTMLYTITTLEKRLRATKLKLIKYMHNRFEIDHETFNRHKK